MKNTRGFVYLAFGDRFVAEAAVSANSIRQHHSYPITLMTDQRPPDKVCAAFDQIEVLPLRKCYSDKILIQSAGYDECIFLDTDTLIVASLDPLFDLLAHFDIAVQFTEGGNHYSLPEVPASFSEPSAGIIVWRKGEVTNAFFDLWRIWYERIEKEMGGMGAWDQRSLRAALFFGKLRLTPIPNEYQFYTYKPQVVAGQVRMIHGRALSKATITSITCSSSFRIWLPRVGGCAIFAHAEIMEVLVWYVRLGFRLAQICIRRLLAWIKVWPLPKCQRPA
jgi:hypothetical protein